MQNKSVIALDWNSKRKYMTTTNEPSESREGLQKSFLRIRHPIKSMAYELFIGGKLSFAEVS